MGRISLARDYRVRERNSKGKEQHKQTFSGGVGVVGKTEPKKHRAFSGNAR